MPRIKVRGSELNQVWTNLIDNAVDAMDGHGSLTVRTSAVAGTTWSWRSRRWPWHRGPEHLDHVFDPFFTTKRPGQGTGLGLNIAFNIVRGSAGRSTSAPGRVRPYSE